jgi:hypothetical protein
MNENIKPENMEAVENTVDNKITNDSSSNDGPILYTEQQVKVIYNEGQKAGYITAIRQIRSEVNDYLNDLIIRVEHGQ